jgi:hypothetical protein
VSLPLAGSAGGGQKRASAQPADEFALDMASPLDVPAFLRRQS